MPIDDKKVVKQEIPGPELNRSAEAESQSFASGDLEEKARQREHKRREGLKDHAHLALIGLFWLVVVLVGIAISLWAWHILTPICWHFLNQDQLDTIHTILFGGAVASILQAYARKYFTS